MSPARGTALRWFSLGPPHCTHHFWRIPSCTGGDRVVEVASASFRHHTWGGWGRSWWYRRRSKSSHAARTDGRTCSVFVGQHTRAHTHTRARAHTHTHTTHTHNTQTCARLRDVSGVSSFSPSSSLCFSCWAKRKKSRVRGVAVFFGVGGLVWLVCITHTLVLLPLSHTFHH